MSGARNKRCFPLRSAGGRPVLHRWGGSRLRAEEEEVLQRGTGSPSNLGSLSFYCGHLTRRLVNLMNAFSSLWATAATCVWRLWLVNHCFSLWSAAVACLSQLCLVAAASTWEPLLQVMECSCSLSIAALPYSHRCNLLTSALRWTHI